MANDYYTALKPASNVDGQTADASDVNAISEAIDSAFDLVEADVDSIGSTIQTQVDLAQDWAEEDEDVNIGGQPAGSYSAKHYSAKASASASDAADSASAASTSENNASASASNASNSETSAAASAVEAATNANLLSVFTPNTQTGDYILVLSDRNGKIIRMNSSSNRTLTVPPGVFSDNVLIPVIGVGTGLVTLVAGSGVTLNYPGGKNLNLRAQGSGVTLWLSDVGSNTWEVNGDLENT